MKLFLSRTKNSSETFHDQIQAYLTLQPIHQWLTPGEEVKDVILLIWNFHKQVFSTSDANCWLRFSILQTLSEIASSLWNTHQWRDHVTNCHHLLKSKFQFKTMFRSWDTKGAQLTPLNKLHIILNPKTLKKLIRKSTVSPYGTPLFAAVDFSGDIFF